MTADEFFTNYSINSKLGYYTLIQALEDLRWAYKLYPDHRNRIISIAEIVKIGLNKKPQRVEKDLNYSEIANERIKNMTNFNDLQNKVSAGSQG